MFTSHQVTYTKQINAPLQAVLAVFHDPPVLMKLSPLITDVSVDPEDKTKYSVVDTFVGPFGYSTKINYTATITLEKDGMRGESAAGAGTRTFVKYTARAVSEGVTEVVEETTVKCFFLLQPFIKRVVDKAHTQTLDRLAAKLENASTHS